MKLLILEPNRRTVNLWSPLFFYLAKQNDLELRVVIPSISTQARDELTKSKYYIGDQCIHELKACFKKFSQKGHSALLTLSPRLGTIIQHFAPDVIHVTGECGYLATAQALYYRQKYCSSCGFTIRGAQNIYKRYLFPFANIEKYVLNRTDAVFAIGNEHEEVVRLKGFKGSVPHIPLGVDTDTFYPMPKDKLAAKAEVPQEKFILGFVGKIIEQKGIYTLLEALHSLPEDIHLLLIGSGREDEQFQLRVKKLSLEGRITRIARVPHVWMPLYMNLMDTLVLPSRETRTSNVIPMLPVPWKEQFGRVLVEAMACKKPVIGAQSGEIPNTIGPGGLTFPPEDSNQLAERILRLRYSKDLCRRLAEKGYERVQKMYSWQVVVERMLDQWYRLSRQGSRTKGQRHFSHVFVR
jgi:glycosyltransferase involved in cell wall biosynthesis